MTKINIILISLVSLLVFTSSFAQDTKKFVYVYNDEGVSTNALAQTLTTLQYYLAPRYQVKTINANDIKKSSWPKETALLVIPGGADRPYHRKLHGLANQRIKAYVRQGGSYLGLCAGAYYAAAYVEFDKGGELEVLGNRELQFFSGKAIGPILAPYHYEDNSGSRAAQIKGAFGKTRVYYNGGGYFEKAKKAKNTKVIAEYGNALPAIVYIQYGQGRVILSGVHIEFDPKKLNATDPYLQKIIPQLNQTRLSRRGLTSQLFKLLKL